MVRSTLGLENDELAVAGVKLSIRRVSPGREWNIVCPSRFPTGSRAEGHQSDNQVPDTLQHGLRGLVSLFFRNKIGELVQIIQKPEEMLEILVIHPLKHDWALIGEPFLASHRLGKTEHCLEVLGNTTKCAFMDPIQYTLALYRCESELVSIPS